MYKKAGLIVGALIVVVAIIIVMVVSGGSKEKPSETIGTDVKTTTEANVAKETAVENVQAPVQNNATSTSILPIDADTLPTPVRTETTGWVQGKTVALIDGELYYTLNLLVGEQNLQLTYIVSESGYNAVNVNDKCIVELQSYTVQSGSTYYLIGSLSIAE